MTQKEKQILSNLLKHNKSEHAQQLILDAPCLAVKLEHISGVWSQKMNAYLKDMLMEMNSLEQPPIEIIPGWPFRYSDSYR